MSTLQFDGIRDYVEIADDADFSVATTGSLTVAAWIRPDVLTFPNAESTGYVHWMGKGAPVSKSGRSECTTRPLRIFHRDQTASVSIYSTRSPGKESGATFRSPSNPVNGFTWPASPMG